MKTAKHLIALTAFSILTITISKPARATLGEVESSIANDAATMQGQMLGQVQLKSASGHVRAQTMQIKRAAVKQYTDENGKVYAISWIGVKHPDLSVLMGTYYSEYAGELKNRHGLSLRRNSTVTTSQAVIHLSGVPRHMHGLVYVPALLPSGVKVEDLQ